MATTIKVKTIKTPNVLLLSEEEVDAMESDIQNVVKNKYDNDYELLGMSGGDNFIVLIFKKTT